VPACCRALDELAATRDLSVLDLGMRERPNRSRRRSLAVLAPRVDTLCELEYRPDAERRHGSRSDESTDPLSNSMADALRLAFLPLIEMMTRFLILFAWLLIALRSLVERSQLDTVTIVPVPGGCPPLPALSSGAPSSTVPLRERSADRLTDVSSPRS
jgi:hypothetical protein